MRWFLPAMAIVLLLTGLAPLASADHDSLRVMVLVEDREYSTGSSCRVTVHTFEKTDHIDVDNVPDVKVGAYSPRSVTVERTGTGIYQGTVKIEQTDALNNFVLIQATATKGRTNPNATVYDSGTDATSIFVSNSSGGAIEALVYAKSVSDSIIKPGTKVTVQGEVVLLGANIEPTDFGFSASYYDPGGNRHDEAIVSSNLSTGKYEGTYTFPQVDYNIDVTITATARYFNDTASRSLSLSMTNFCVVYHNLGKGANQSSFEFYAADPYGVPVSGASVELSYWPDNNPGAEKRKDIGSTDAGGRVSGTIDFINGTRELHVRGHLNATGKSQTFSGTVEMPGTAGNFQPSGSGFEAVYTGADRIYNPGKTIEREYAVFNNSAPWASKDVYCYVSAAHLWTDRPLAMSTSSLVQARTYSTDPGGRVKVSFDTPSQNSYVFITLKSATGAHPKQAEAGHYSTDGLYYSEDSDMVVSAGLFSGSEVSIEASSLKIGTPLKVKASMHGAESESAAATWVPGPFEPYAPTGAGSYDWQTWTTVMAYLNRSNGDFSGSLSIPSFMPRNLTFTMLVIVGARNTTMPYYGTAALRPAQELKPPMEIPWLWVIIIVLIIAAAAGGAAYAVRARRRRALAPPKAPVPAAGTAAAPAAVPTTIQLTITCPKCKTQFIATRGPVPTRVRCPSCGTEGTLPPLPAQPAPAAPPAAPAPAPAAGVKLSITCPSCKTPFEVTRGFAPARIKCPSCGTEGTLPPLPQPAAAAPVPQAPAPPEAPARYPTPDSRLPTPEPRPPAPGTRPSAPSVQMKTIACPRCKQRFTIEKREGPQQIRCPHCGKEGTIGGKPAAAAPPAPAPPLPVPQAEELPPPAEAPLPPAQPLVPARYPAPGPRYPAPVIRPPAPGTRPPKMITCPQCRVPFPVNDPRRPLPVKCPNCGKEGVLRK